MVRFMFRLKKSIIYNPEQIVASDPNISECSARGDYVDLITPVKEFQLTKLESPVYFRGKEVVVVVGAVACDRCVKRCPNAYLTASTQK
jgi:hypothetical protein